MAKMNFKELLGNYRIEIPMLQRDYAQGRLSQVRVANSFLDSIFEVLEYNKTLHIDFIYGYKEDTRFILIDGQQRITTLWLLYFYLHKFVGRLGEVRALLENFSYSSRKSSKKFCKNLLFHEFDIDIKPSEAISSKIGSFGNQENLKNDPTIKSMINMLDLIYQRKDVINNDIVNNLNNITFEVFDMGYFSLGEELYIKMNSRGKQLSDYESLKAYMEKTIDIKTNREILVNIDTKWDKYFFDYINVDKFDKRAKVFLHYATIFFKFNSGKILKNKDLNDYVKDVNRKVDDFYSELQNIENLKWLDRTIELFLSFNTHFRKDMELKMSNSSFFDIRNDNKDSLEYSKICYFFSILSYMEHKSCCNINKNDLCDYLRVSKHFIENYNLNTSDDIDKFFYLFKHLSQNNSNVYIILRENINYGFNTNIYILESRKAALILQSRKYDTEWEKVLNQTSDNEYLIGWVDFLLDFSDENFEYKSYKKYDPKYINPKLELFKSYSDLTMKIIENSKQSKEKLSLFHRALLSIGNYSFVSVNNFYGGYFSSLSFRDREAYNFIFSGRKNKQQMPYFKKLLDRLLTSKKETIDEKLQEVIDSTYMGKKNWWEQILIKQGELFEFLNKNKDRFESYPRIRNKFRGVNKNKYELLPNKRNFVNVRDVLDFGFYCYCRDKGYDIEPNEYKSPEPQYGTKYPLVSHFSISNQPVICDSIESRIQIGKQRFAISLQKSKNIFHEFDRILKDFGEQDVYIS